MNEDIFSATIQTAAVLYVVVRILRYAWTKVKEKQKLSELGMHAIVEVEKQKWKEDVEDITEEADS